MSDLQRDIDLVDEAMHTTQPWSRSDWAAAVEAWQRIRARLTPDRERVAEAIKDVLNDHGWETDRHDRPALLQAAGAAIDAMKETP